MVLKMTFERVDIVKAYPDATRFGFMEGMFETNLAEHPSLKKYGEEQKQAFLHGYKAGRDLVT